MYLYTKALGRNKLILLIELLTVLWFCVDFVTTYQFLIFKDSISTTVISFIKNNAIHEKNISLSNVTIA